MKKLFAFLRRLMKNFKALAKKYVHPAVQIVEGLKKAVDSPISTFFTAFIPGDLDDYILQRLKIVLPTVLKSLQIIDASLTNSGDFEALIKSAIENIKELDKDAQAAKYHSIAALLSVYLSDGKLTWREAIHLAEEVYQTEYVK